MTTKYYKYRYAVCGISDHSFIPYYAFSDPYDALDYRPEEEREGFYLAVIDLQQSVDIVVQNGSDPQRIRRITKVLRKIPGLRER